ncbi:PH domain-containing protein [Paeniglutamicibacter cryotolerans]
MAGDGSWRRVHPVSPLVRGWIAVVAIAFVYGQNAFNGLLNPGMEADPGGAWLAERGPLAVLIGLGVLLLVVLGFVASWWFTRYQITEHHVNVNSGIIFRQQRQARIDRVQAVDIAQPLLARIFGLAELKFDVADSGQSAMSLSYVKLAEAKELRNEILFLASGLKPTTVPPARATDTATSEQARIPALEATEFVVASVPPGRLVGSLLLHPLGISLAVSVIVIVVLMLKIEGFGPFVLLPTFLGLGGALWNGFNQGWNFKAATGDDGLRVSYGLLDTRHQTVPPGRVQAIRISSPWLWRALGWYRVTVNVAGFGQNTDTAQRSTLLPVGRYDDVMAVLSVVLPDPGTADPVELFRAGISGSGPDHGFTGSPRSVRPLSPLAWRRQGYAVTGTALLARSGVLHRTLVVVPHERSQGLLLTQGPLARRCRVANVHLATTPGPVSPVVKQLALGDARTLFLEQADRAAAARALHDANHWIQPAARQTPSGPDGQRPPEPATTKDPS